MIANIRCYKGVPELPAAGEPKSIDLAGRFDQWKDVAPEFRDHVGETIPRDHDGVAGLHYTDQSGRNDLVASKVTHDAENVYFYLRTAEAIRPATTPDGLWLFIDSDQDPKTGWEGYDLLVGREVGSDGKLSVEHHKSGWLWEKTASAPFRLEGNQLHLALPRTALGLKSNEDVSLDFKWADIPAEARRRPRLQPPRRRRPRRSVQFSLWG